MHYILIITTVLLKYKFLDDFQTNDRNFHAILKYRGKEDMV